MVIGIAVGVGIADVLSVLIGGGTLQIAATLEDITQALDRADLDGKDAELVRSQARRAGGLHGNAAVLTRGGSACRVSSQARARSSGSCSTRVHQPRRQQARLDIKAGPDADDRSRGEAEVRDRRRRNARDVPKRKSVGGTMGQQNRSSGWRHLSIFRRPRSKSSRGPSAGGLLALGLRECGYGASRTGIGGSGHNRWPKRYLADDVICE
jgi:hypothetical protein